MPDAVRIRRAQPADAEPLAELAARTFHDAFAADNRPEDVAAHLAEVYGAPQQREEIDSPAMCTLVADREGVLVAFAQVRRSAPPPCVTSPEPVEIWRFYVDRAWHGRGVAQRLMDAALAESRAMGAGSSWLGVWERNPRAAAFYRKVGFVRVGSHEFLLGEDRQTDDVMVLTPSREPGN